MSKPNAPVLALVLHLAVIPSLLTAVPARGDALPKGVFQNLVLAPGDNNPRNSEGDFVHLRDGRILFIYSHFIGGKREEPAAYLASRASLDAGKTWTDHDEIVIDSRAHGVPVVLSVSLLRLKDDRIALFYLEKERALDSRMVMRTSVDEAKTWSEPTVCTDGPGYVLVSNGRVVQLKNGRIIFPAAQHNPPAADGFDRGVATCFFSDDNGVTWHHSTHGLEAPANSHSGMKEPAVVELNDEANDKLRADPNGKPGAGPDVKLRAGRLMMLMCMHLKPHHRSFSTDGGDTWSPAEATDLVVPVSPMSIKRIPSTGDLLLVWNDHSHVDPALKGKRTPLTVAISKDEGMTWVNRKNLYEDADGSYGYTAIDFVGDRVLLGHCAGQAKAGLARTVITSFDVEWLYK